MELSNNLLPPDPDIVEFRSGLKPAPHRAKTGQHRPKTGPNRPKTYPKPANTGPKPAKSQNLRPGPEFVEFGDRPWPRNRLVVANMRVCCGEPQPQKTKLGRTYGRILDFSFGFGSFSCQTWPQDPFKWVRLEKWCRTHSKSAPETNSNDIS